MKQNERSSEILSAFCQYKNTGKHNHIEAFTLAELRSADEDFANIIINETYRLAIRNRIKELEEEREDRRALSIRSTGYGLMFVIAVCSGLIVYYLTNG